jgi:hypothetical protein
MNAYPHHNQRPALTAQEATHPIATEKQRMHEKLIKPKAAMLQMR